MNKLIHDLLEKIRDGNDLDATYGELWAALSESTVASTLSIKNATESLMRVAGSEPHPRRTMREQVENPGPDWSAQGPVKYSD